MNRALISLGSNLGDSKATLKNALALLEQIPGIKVDKISSFYRTPPIGGVLQDDFINACALLSVTLNAHDLMQTLLNIEKEFKRERIIRWGPRTLDLDLLYYGNEFINNERLIVPHPQILLRAFVVIPLLEIAPDFKTPDGFLLRDIIPKLPKDDVEGLKVI